MPADPVQTARDLAVTGQADDAARMLRSAGDGGDAQALAELATWYLAGDKIARNLPEARTLLRRAVTIGHVDAALTEIALTANGSGGVADWAAARSLLESAAQSDPLAAQQLQLLGLMQLDGQGYPLTVPHGEVLSDRPRIVRFPAFLTPYECGLIAQTARDMLEPSLVADPLSGALIPHPIRQSSAAPISPTRESLPVQAVLRRIAAATRTKVCQGESLTVLHYAPGQQYKMHMDALPGTANQRVATMILYLNDGYQGGETQFEGSGLAFKAQAGDALYFANVTPDGAPDPLSRHAGLPVRQGQKWVATRWIRARPFEVWHGPESA